MRVNKIIPTMCFCLATISTLSSCVNDEKDRIIPDYATAELFELALNSGKDAIGKTVYFIVDNIKPDSAFGFDIWAGEHLNFISEESLEVEIGDYLTVKVNEVANFLGSWLIHFDLISID